jgi:hypothetical protein
MATIALGTLFGLILRELDDAFRQTVHPADLFRQHNGAAALEPQVEILHLHVSDLDLELPAHLQVQMAPDARGQGAHLMVTLPSTLEQPPAGRLGRIRLTIISDQPRR